MVVVPLAAIFWSGAATAATTDVIDDFLYYSLACNGYGNLVWADVDGDGNFDTQVVFETITGLGDVVNDFNGPGFWYFFSFQSTTGSSCVEPTEDRARIRIRFVDLEAPGVDLNDSTTYLDPTTWVYKPIPEVSIQASHDLCVRPSADPNIVYQSVNAYRQLNQTDLVTDQQAPLGGNWIRHEFSDPIGILELFVSSDYCENTLDELILGLTGNPGIVQVFDVSGSMGWSPSGQSGVPVAERRITYAKAAGVAFLDMLNGQAGASIEVGLAGFPAQPWSFGSGCAGQVRQSVSVLTPGAYSQLTNTVIPGLSPQGNTPLLAGIETARGMFTDQSNRSVVLLSDGYHNCPSGVSGPGDPAIVGLITNLQASNVTVFPIGFGRPADIDHVVLDALASGTGGWFFDATGDPGFNNPGPWDPATALAASYAKALAAAQGLAIPADPLTSIQAEKTAAHAISITEFDEKVTFFVSWVTPQNQYLPLTLTASDGSQVFPGSQAGVLVQERPTSTVITVDGSLLAQPGKVGATPWTLGVSGTLIDEGASENYQYTVLARSGLNVGVDFDKPSYRTGDTLLLTARVTQQGAPLAKLRVAKVEVTGPSASVGSWFANNPVDSNILGRVPFRRAGEILPSLQRAALAISGELNQPYPGRTAPETLELEKIEVESRDDSSALYRAAFTGLRKDGMYAFLVTLSGETPRGITYQRQAMVQKYVSARVAAQTLIPILTVVPGLDPRFIRFTATATPMDNLGNHLGPGHAAKFSFAATGGASVGSVVDNRDGSYTQIMEFPAGTDPSQVKMIISADGVVLKHGPAEPPVEIPGLIWILFGIAFLLIVFLFLRSARK